MKITVEYAAQARQATGVAAEQVDVEPTCSVQQLIAQLADKHGHPLRNLILDGGGDLHGYILLFVGGQPVRWQTPTPLTEHDVVTILSPISGG